MLPVCTPGGSTSVEYPSRLASSTRASACGRTANLATKTDFAGNRDAGSERFAIVCACDSEQHCEVGGGLHDSDTADARSKDIAISECNRPAVRARR